MKESLRVGWMGGQTLVRHINISAWPRRKCRWMSSLTSPWRTSVAYVWVIRVAALKRSIWVVVLVIEHDCGYLGREYRRWKKHTWKAKPSLRDSEPNTSNRIVYSQLRIPASVLVNTVFSPSVAKGPHYEATICHRGEHFVFHFAGSNHLVSLESSRIDKSPKRMQFRDSKIPW